MNLSLDILKKKKISEVNMSYEETFLSSLSLFIAFLLEGLLQLKWKVFLADRVDKESKTGRKERGRKGKKK